MYVQASKTTINGKTYVCKTVRESYRTAKGPRSRMVCNISKLPEHVQSAIEQLLRNPESSLIPSDSLGLSDALGFGGVAVLHDAWEKYHLDQALAGVDDTADRARLKAMIFARMLFPGSKLSLKTLSADTALAPSCGLSQDALDEDRLYNAMDALSGNWVGIEKNLYSEAFSSGVTLVLYDLTSSYFEGAKHKKLAAYGYSRDHRDDRMQMILALATNTDGIPIHMEVLKGNRADNRTLLPLLASLRRRFGIGKAVFAFDGGMSSSLNLEQMRNDEFDYVTRLSTSTLKSLVESLPADNQPELWDRDSLAEFEVDGRRYVVAGSEYRKQRDQERREARIAKGRCGLEKFNEVNRKHIDVQKLSSQVGRMLDHAKALKYFEFHIEADGKATWSEKSDAINSEQRLDGWYLLTTTLARQEAPKETVFGHYRNLLAVEDAFRETKTYLEMRPIFHQRDDRVRNHIRICFLAYWISARLKSAWKQLGEHREVPSVLRELQQIRVGKLKMHDLPFKAVLTEIPTKTYSTLERLGLLALFQRVPQWAM
jgi:transposase